MNYKFKYFNDPLKNARYVQEPCDFCGDSHYCLNGDYLDSKDEIVSVCLNCLVQGKVEVEFPEFLYDRIRADVGRVNSQLEEDAIGVIVKNIMSILGKNPPVPWVQNNDWPVCCGDFMLFLKELERKDFESCESNANGKEILFNMLDDESRDKIDSLESLWDELGDYTIAYQFECLTCYKKTVVLQSF